MLFAATLRRSKRPSGRVSQPILGVAGQRSVVGTLGVRKSMLRRSDEYRHILQFCGLNRALRLTLLAVVHRNVTKRDMLHHVHRDRTVHVCAPRGPLILGCELDRVRKVVSIRPGKKDAKVERDSGSVIVAVNAPDTFHPSSSASSHLSSEQSFWNSQGGPHSHSMNPSQQCSESCMLAEMQGAR